MDYAPASDKKVRFYIQNIRADLEGGGYRIVPFTGAGYSVAAGIPAAPQLKRFQIYSLLRALGIDPLQTIPDSVEKIAYLPPLDLRGERWPDMASEMVRNETVRDVDELENLLKAVLGFSRKRGYLLKVGVVRIAYKTLRLGYGALADWRAALDFLSRLSVQTGQNREPEAIPGLPEPTVKDTFFRQLVRHKHPGLAHRTLQALCPVLRSHVILSTNFDDLLEEAFRAVDHPLTVFPVPMDAALPGAQLVLAQRSLVKLHGGSYGLWADDAIDRPPTLADKANFLAYLAGRVLPAQDDLPLEDAVGLLLLGVSGSDQRTISLLRAALLRFKRLHIYWLCFSSADEENVRTLFKKEIRSDKPNSKEENGNWVWPLRHLDQGLFMLQLYQECACSVPTAGIIFPALWELPFPAYLPPPNRKVKKYFEKKFQELGQTIYEQLRKERSPKGRRMGIKPVIIYSKEDATGAVSVCSQLFWADHLDIIEEDGTHERPLVARRVWIDLESIVEPAGFFLRLVLLLAKRLGETDPICVLNVQGFYDASQEFGEAVMAHLRNYYAQTGEKTIVFINGYDGAGTDALFTWDRIGGRSWTDKAAVKPFIDLLVTINQETTCGVQFVLIHRQNFLSEPVQGPLKALADSSVKLDRIAVKSLGRMLSVQNEGEWEPESISEPCSAFIRQDAVKAAIAFTERTESAHSEFDWLRPYFLYLLTLFRVTRYPASLIRIIYVFAKESPHFPQGRAPRLTTVQERVDDWLTALEQSRVVYRKMGGFVWMSYILKEGVREYLVQTKMQREHALFIESLIARWYGRLLLGCADPLSAMQSISHGLGAIQTWLKWPNAKTAASETERTRLGLCVKHAQLIFQMARTLWESKLSDQFATRALLGLQSLALSTMEQLAASAADQLHPEMATLLTTSVRELHDAIRRFRAKLFLLEGDYEEMHRCTDEIMTSLQSEGDHTSGDDRQGDHEKSRCYARLYKATGLVCQRRYQEGQHLLEELWNERGGGEIGRGKGAEAAREWLFPLRQSESRSDWEQRMMCRIGRRFLYFALHKSQAVYCHQLTQRVTTIERQRAREHRRNYLARRGEWMADFCLEVLRAVQPTSDAFVFEENVSVRAHAALCRGIMDSCESQTDGKPRHKLAESFLSDAESYIDEFPLKEGGMNRAILELRRAELELLRVQGSEVVASGPDSWFREFRRELRELDAHDPRRGAFKSRALPAREEGARIEQTLARLFDAFRYLDRAETDLRKHPKNRWWWWIFCVLKMKATEYSYVVSLAVHLLSRGQGAAAEALSPAGADGSPKPSPWERPSSMSPEMPPAAALFFDSEVLSVVRNSGMLDPFQLARLIDSFSRTLQASVLQDIYARAGAATLDEYKRRFEGQQHLADRLRIALKSVAAGRIDEDVRAYGQRISELSGSALGSVKKWLKDNQSAPQIVEARRRAHPKVKRPPAGKAR